MWLIRLNNRILHIHCAVSLLLLVLIIGMLEFSYVYGNSLNTLQGKISVLDLDGNEIPERENVVVFLDGVSPDLASDQQQTIPKISHKGRKFSPHVLPILKGDDVDFFNDDRIFHNVFSLSKAKTFDLGIYPQGTSKLVNFSRTGLVKLYCNIHPKMVSNILVLNNRWFTKTNKKGLFIIKNIPDGEYIVRFWHEFSESVSIPVTFQLGQTITRDLNIRMTKKRRSHNNKFGKPYRKKY